MFDIGVVRRGTFPGRTADTLALGFASDQYNVRLQALERSLQSEGFAVPNTVQDQIVELTYGFQVAPWFIVRPGLQFAINPGGIKANPGAGIIDPPGNALVIGLGGYISL
jgi:porin